MILSMMDRRRPKLQLASKKLWLRREVLRLSLWKNSYLKLWVRPQRRWFGQTVNYFFCCALTSRSPQETAGLAKSARQVTPSSWWRLWRSLTSGTSRRQLSSGPLGGAERAGLSRSMEEGTTEIIRIPNTFFKEGAWVSQRLSIMPKGVFS